MRPEAGKLPGALRYMMWVYRTQSLALGRVVVAIAVWLAALCVLVPGAGAVTAHSETQRCPWVAQSRDAAKKPDALAREVLARMSLSQKAGFVVLSHRRGVENINNGVRALCIPPLTLTDGPDGVANRMSGVEQMPAEIGIAASFDPSLARRVGAVIGREARSKGFMVLQGPELNLARVPESGRVFETFGEDPLLTSRMGVSVIDGIQSQGEIAQAKHFTGYTQETGRRILNQSISKKSLAELYNVPFRAAVVDAKVGSVMCSYGFVNGYNDCSSPYVYKTLSSWGFRGFVRSDLVAVPDQGAAFGAGLDLIKPSAAGFIASLVRDGVLSSARLDRAVLSVLTEMFARGMISHPPKLHLGENVVRSEDRSVAENAGAESAVLLKNKENVLPLTGGSVAIIGLDAGRNAVTSGSGSSSVSARSFTTPLAAFQRSGRRIIFAPGDVAARRFVPLAGIEDPQDFSQHWRGWRRWHGGGKGDLFIDTSPGVTPAAVTATRPGSGSGWSDWHSTVTPARTGLYEIAVRSIGDVWTYVNGRKLIVSPGLHVRNTDSTTIYLRAGREYTFSARWFAVARRRGPSFSITRVDPLIAAAVRAARKSQTAIVFVGAREGEGGDRASLDLGGDADALIRAVAKANPRTVVVLNTGGAVLMPWVNEVAGIVEDWYPGQEDGEAIRKILTGEINPSGHLPISFPTYTERRVGIGAGGFPGNAGVVAYNTGLYVGYRWYQKVGLRPLFPFGYGLSYTNFSLGRPSVLRTRGGYEVDAPITNIGDRGGRGVVQAYVHDPGRLSEPSEALRGFGDADLLAGQSKTVRIEVPLRSLCVYRGGRMRLMSGVYRFDIGQSSAVLPFHVNVALRGGAC